MLEPADVRRVGVMLSLVAPVSELCEAAALHVRDALERLVVGGVAVGEWLDIICPHGLADGWVHVTWRTDDGRGVWARLRFGVDGVAHLHHVSLGATRESLDGFGFSEVGLHGAVSMVAGTSLCYTMADIIEWLIAFEAGEDRPLGKDAGTVQSGGSGVVGGHALSGSVLIDCSNWVDPERN